MHRAKFSAIAIATVMAGLLAVNAGAQEAPAVDVSAQSAQDASGQGGSREPRCKRIHGDLLEAPATVGCKPEHTSCFLGEVDANHGLRGTTYFKGDPGAVLFPPTAPTFRAYTGNFEYTTAHGTLIMKEMGMTEPFTASNPQSGVVNAYQRVVDGTGEFEGATGYLFVSGFNRNQRVVTTLHGEICKARHGQ
jgi:hypothetical protein